VETKKSSLYALQTVLVVLETVVEGKLMADTLFKCFELCEKLLRHRFDHEHKADICHALLSIVQNAEHAYNAGLSKAAANTLCMLCCGCTAEWKQEFLVRAREVQQQLPHDLQDLLRYVTDDRHLQHPAGSAPAKAEPSPAQRTSAEPSRSRAALDKLLLQSAPQAAEETRVSVKRAPAAATAAAATAETATAAAAAPVTTAVAPTKVRSKPAGDAALKLDAAAAAAARVLADAESCASAVQEDNSLAVDQSRVQTGDAPAVRTEPAVSATTTANGTAIAAAAGNTGLAAAAAAAAATLAAAATTATSAAVTAAAVPARCSSSSEVPPVASTAISTAVTAAYEDTSSGSSHQVHAHH
jgi:hypothetical protein